MANLIAGKGHYGDVFLAKAHGIREGQPETLVVVKSLLSRDEVLFHTVVVTVLRYSVEMKF